MIFDITKYVDTLEEKFRGDENKWLRVSMKLQLQLEQALVIISEGKNRQFCEQFITAQDQRLSARCGKEENMEYDWETGYSQADSDIVSAEQRKLDSAGYWLESILERLYDDQGPVDEFSLACDLDELCHLLDVKRKTGLLQVQRKEKQEPKVREFLNDMEA